MYASRNSRVYFRNVQTYILNCKSELCLRRRILYLKCKRKLSAPNSKSSKHLSDPKHLCADISYILINQPIVDPTDYHIAVAPRWTVEPSDSSAAAGQDVILHCGASGHPEPTITWRKAVGEWKYNTIFVHSIPTSLKLHNGSLPFFSLLFLDLVRLSFQVTPPGNSKSSCSSRTCPYSRMVLCSSPGSARRARATIYVKPGTISAAVSANLFFSKLTVSRLFSSVKEFFAYAFAFCCFCKKKPT